MDATVTIESQDLAVVWLVSIVEAERRRQADIEAQRRRDGGMYDIILQRWVSIHETR
jgi:hypothetical protein